MRNVSDIKIVLQLDNYNVLNAIKRLIFDKHFIDYLI